MTTYLTSGVYDAWDALTRLMSETSWPTIAENPDGVAVWFGDPTLEVNDEADITASTERVVVVSAVDASQQEYGPVGQLARNEEFNCLIVVISAVPGRTAADVKDRLRDLTSTIENRIREVLLDGRSGVVLDEFQGYQVARVSVREVNPICVPGPNGSIGRAEVVIGCEFRVGTPPVG